MTTLVVSPTGPLGLSQGGSGGRGVTPDSLD